MKSKRTAPSRRRVSFAVDRDDIDVNSDWVEAVMALPVAATAETPTTSQTTPLPAENSPLEATTVEDKESDAISTTVPEIIPEAHNATGLREEALRRDALTVARDTADSATAAQNASPLLRKPKLRILNRITDGLTPGQLAVYRVMYDEGESSEDHARIYRGGYADLGRLTGMSKRGIQNVVGELQAKQVIRIHRKPGHHRTETSAYIVPDAERVLETWLSKGWRHAAGKSKVLTP
jgi:hypothetical protein